MSLYNQLLGTLQKNYAELVTFSNNRMSDLDTLLDFIQSATNELHWLNEKEEVEVARDWSDTNMNLQAVEKYYEVSFIFIFILFIYLTLNMYYFSLCSIVTVQVMR